MHPFTHQPNQMIRRSKILLLLLAGITAACAGPSGPAPVVNRSYEVPHADAPVYDSAGAVVGRAAAPPAQPQPVAAVAKPPLASAEPVAEEMLPADGSAVVRSSPIRAGRIESSPIAGDASGNSAPIITMSPVVTAAQAPSVAAQAKVELPASPVAKRPEPKVSAAPAKIAAPAIAPVASRTPSSETAASPAAAAPAAVRPFIWPAAGAVTKSFTDPKSMGIAIAGKAGARVSAAGDGRIIFSGLGPRGYGKLLIVKHDDDLLSVYANNRVLLVKEGQAVRQGQKIAELGSSGTDQPRLHFEIRRLGKPVDPISYLPPNAN